MEYDLTPNDRFAARVEYVGREREPLLVVDDFLADPESMVRYAVQEVEFHPPTSAYPGIIAQAPVPYAEAVLYGLGDRIEELFGVRTETAQVVSSFFGLVTLPPDRLAPEQRIPHVDDLHPGRIAVLHFFCSPDQGGTGFYRHRGTGFETVTPDRDAELREALWRDGKENGPPPPGYIVGDAGVFEQTARVDARFNRLLVYRSRVFHSGLVGPSTRLDPNPRVGRLTVNTFYRFEPRAPAEGESL